MADPATSAADAVKYRARASFVAMTDLRVIPQVRERLIRADSSASKPVLAAKPSGPLITLADWLRSQASEEGGALGFVLFQGDHGVLGLGDPRGCERRKLRLGQSAPIAFLVPFSLLR